MKNKAAKENIFVVLTIAICFVVTLGLSMYFSGDGFLNVFSFEKKSSHTVYTVAAGGYNDIVLARSTSELIKKRGGAGYVSGSGPYEIIYAVYPDEESAKAVLSAIGESGAYVGKIELADCKLKWASGDLKSASEAALKYYDGAFDALYAVSNGLNDSSMTVADAKTKVKVLYSQIEDIKSNFYSAAADSQKEQVTEIKLALITTLALLDNITASDNLAEYLSSVRYALVQLVLCRKNLLI